MSTFLASSILPGGLPLLTLLQVWATCLLLGLMLGVYHRRLASLGPKLPFYLVVVVSFTAFLFVVFDGVTHQLSVGSIILYGIGSLVSGLLVGGLGLWLTRFC